MLYAFKTRALRSGHLLNLLDPTSQATTANYKEALIPYSQIEPLTKKAPALVALPEQSADQTVHTLPTAPLKRSFIFPKLQ